MNNIKKYFKLFIKKNTGAVIGHLGTTAIAGSLITYGEYHDFFLYEKSANEKKEQKKDKFKFILENGPRNFMFSFILLLPTDNKHSMMPFFFTYTYFYSCFVLLSILIK